VRALVFHGPGDVGLEDVPRPEPGPGDVLVHVEVALTDGTDLKAFRRGHPVLLGEPPSLFGHEFCGFDVATGKRVAGANSAPCGSCPACRRGQPTLCESLRPLLNGAYAEYLLVPAPIAATNLMPVPDALPGELAAMVEPLACCLHGVDVAGIDAGATVAVLGLGPIGLMLCACVADAGGWPVGVGSRIVIEAAGTEEAWQQALELVRPGGTVVYFGGLPSGTQVPLDATKLHYGEVTVRGAFHHAPRHVRAALAFLASRAYPWERLVTHRVGLEGVAPLLADPPRDYLKAAVLP
jgi:L-iditol 2-dehydrogenase